MLLALPPGRGRGVPDRQRGLRFHLDELPALARGIALALEEALCPPRMCGSGGLGASVG
jgi:hypothetical protein